uniref:K-box domain-containing protein n=1 Tax=Salix viminalis TaxID=40686 RepID=A0A6N2L2X5_SALVM
MFLRVCVLAGMLVACLLKKRFLREVDVLKEEISKLQVKQLRLSGKDLAGLSLKELQQLENQLNEGLLCVKEKKERLLMEQLEQSRVQIEELRGLFPSTDHSVPTYLEYYATERKNSPTDNGSASPPVAHYICSIEKVDSDTTLHLGLPTGTYRKRKALEGESHSNDSDSRLSLL